MNSESTAKEPKAWAIPIVLIVGLVGWQVGQYAAGQIIIPAVGAGLVGWLASKLIRGRAKPFVPALAVQGGFLVWMVVELCVLWQPFIAGHVVVLALGLAWLMLRPGLAPVTFLALYQVLALAANLSAWLQVPVGGVDHRVLTVYLLFRLLALVALGAGLWRLRRQDRAETLSPGDVGASASCVLDT